MELCIESKLQGESLIVTANGSVRFDSVLLLLQQICDTAAENHVNKILVCSLAVDGELAAFERYRLGTELAAYLAQRHISVKLAFVGNPPTVNGFGVRIARNRGITARVFSSHQDAQSWLEDVSASGDAPGLSPDMS